MGATRRSAAQHSQSLHAWPSHIPGLKVVVPSTPYDAKGLFKAAVRDDNPVVIFEHKISYRKVKGPVPEEDYIIPLGVADVKRQGRDITIIAAEQHGADGARRARSCSRTWASSAEVVDPRTMWPLDEKTLIESVKKTSRCIVMDEGYGRYGVAGELAATVAGGGVLRPRRAGDAGCARCTCRFRSRRRSKTRRCRTNARSSTWRRSCVNGNVASGSRAGRPPEGGR